MHRSRAQPVPVTCRTQLPWARCILKRQVQLAVRGVGFVVVRFVEPQHVWDLGWCHTAREDHYRRWRPARGQSLPPIAAAANPDAM